jgi:uncharacterized membrane protein
MSSILKRGALLGAFAGLGVVGYLLWRRKGHAHPPAIATVTINKPPREVYEFFRRFDRLPQFMTYLASVEVRGDRRSTWTARLPLGKTVQWNAEIVEDRPGEAIAWKSTDDSTVAVAGRVTFTRTVGRDMTEMRAEILLGALGRAPSAGLARLFARPQVKADLRRLKQVMETGEVLYSDASVHRHPHAAQPSRRRDTSPEIFIHNPPTAAKGVAP